MKFFQTGIIQFLPVCKNAMLFLTLPTLSNPFDWDILDNLKKFACLDKTSRPIISEPENIDLLFQFDTSTPAINGHPTSFFHPFSPLNSDSPNRF